MRASLCGAAIVVLAIAAAVRAAEPRVQDGYRLELVASAPEIVTPIGMAFDREGRLLVVESHTHERAKGKEYAGPAADRIRMFFDSNGDGKLDKWVTLAEGFRDAMNVLPRNDGAFYVVTRRDLQLVRPPSGPGQAGEVKTLLRLETDDQYSHNGLEGICITADGSLLVSMGENHGMAFKLVGSDGSAVSGVGEGGNVFRCSQDGGNVQRWAVGFWNPFSLAVVGRRVFAADNDPDASPPCRLLEVVPGGDYGFRFRYGRAGLHPLQAWNGELPGTLPMVCGIGEAPTALVWHRGALWVTSWGDHRIERYTLAPRGASFSATREIPVQGDADFRPTGMAAAPDGSLYFGDWVIREYPVHGRGRLWRLTLPAAEASAEAAAPWADEIAPVDGGLVSSDPFVRAAVIWDCVQNRDPEADAQIASKDAGVRLGHLEALRIQGTSNAEAFLAKSLADESPEVRLFAVRWIADERITGLRDQVAKLLEGPQTDFRYYLAVLAAVDWLDNKDRKPGGGFTNALLAKELQNPARSDEARALVLSLLAPDDKFLTIDRLRAYLKSQYAPLRLEAVRALAQQSSVDRFGLLAEIAGDERRSDELRAEAIMGLAGSEGHRELLERLASDGSPHALRREARRALRLGRGERDVDPKKPPLDDLAAWTKLLEEPGNAAAGRRLFFSSVGGRCSACHQYAGRGGRIGPDLTQVGRSVSRERIVTSILHPSREIAPEYQAWLLVTADGQSRQGLRLSKAGDDGTELYADPQGERFSLKSEAIEIRTPSAKSIMPDGMEQVLSVDDLRDLVAFLIGESRRDEN